MRIALVTNSYPPNLNGVSVAVKNLETALIAQNQEVFIITPRVPNVNYPKNVLAINSTPTPKTISQDLRFPIFDAKVQTFLKDNQIQLVHSHDTIMGGLETVIAALEVGIPCLHTYHTLLESYEYFKLPGYKQFIRSYSQIVCDSYDGVIALSDKINNYLQEIKVSTPIYKIPNIFLPPVIGNSIDPEIKNWIQASNLEQTFNILTFGRVAKEKNLESAIEILAPLLHHYPNIRYIIAGDGPDLKNLKLLVEELGLEKQVIFSGAFQRHQIQTLCNYSKVFLNTSYSEVLPTTPLEAMYYSLPVVCVDDLAFNYLLKDGYNGYQAPIKSLSYFCEKLYLEPDLLATLSTQAKISADLVCSNNPIEKYLELYQFVIDQHVKSPEKDFLFYNILKNLVLTQRNFNDLINNKLTRAHL